MGGIRPFGFGKSSLGADDDAVLPARCHLDRMDGFLRKSLRMLNSLAVLAALCFGILLADDVLTQSAPVTGRRMGLC